MFESTFDNASGTEQKPTTFINKSENVSGTSLLTDATVFSTGREPDDRQLINSSYGNAVKGQDCPDVIKPTALRPYLLSPSVPQPEYRRGFNRTSLEFSSSVLRQFRPELFSVRNPQLLDRFHASETSSQFAAEPDVKGFRPAHLSVAMTTAIRLPFCCNNHFSVCPQRRDFSRSVK